MPRVDPKEHHTTTILANISKPVKENDTAEQGYESVVLFTRTTKVGLTLIMSSSDISLSSAEEMMSVSSGGSPSTFSMFPRRNRTIPELLAAREGYGMSNTSVVKKYRVDSSLLSYRGAW